METTLSTHLAERIREETGENVFLCYQCVKCTSGCPLAEFFDLAPNQVLRAAQLGMEERLFDSRTPWLCASCQPCTTRCPQGIDVARPMDFLVPRPRPRAGWAPPREGPRGARVRLAPFAARRRCTTTRERNRLFPRLLAPLDGRRVRPFHPRRSGDGRPSAGRAEGLGGLRLHPRPPRRRAPGDAAPAREPDPLGA